MAASSSSRSSQNPDASFAPPKRKSVVQRLFGRSSETPTEDPNEWEVGSSYELLYSAMIRRQASFDSDELYEIPKGGKVLLLARNVASRSDGTQVERGLVQDSQGTTGWLSFHNRDKRSVLKVPPLEESWRVGKQYLVMSATTIREEVAFDSGVVCELPARSEVLLLAFGAAVRPDTAMHALRARVQTREGKIGWLSCLTASRQALLETKGVKTKGGETKGAEEWPAERDQLRESQVASAPVQQSARGSVFGGTVTVEEAKEWEVGCSYEVCYPATLRKSFSMESDVMCDVPKNAKVLLLERGHSIRPDGSQVLRGLVQDYRGVSGWLSLQTKSGVNILKRLPLEERSWSVGGRYLVAAATTIRENKGFESSIVAELQAEEEILILAFGVAQRPETPDVQALRAQVHTRAGQVGWLSCLTAKLTPLLLTTDLMKEPKAESQGSSRMSLFRRSEKTVTKLPGAACAWEVGGKYRAIQEIVMQMDKELSSQKVRTIPKGGMIIMEELSWVDGKAGMRNSILGRSAPQLLRSLCHAEEYGVTGWITCQDQNGKAFLDSRDHLELEKIKFKLESSASPLQEDASDGSPASRPSLPGPQRCSLLNAESRATAFGVLIKEGVIEKKSPALLKGWQMRAFRIQTHAIQYSAAANWDPKTKQCIMLNTVKVVRLLRGRGHIGQFEVVTSAGKVFKLRAPGLSDARSWVDAIYMAAKASGVVLATRGFNPENPDDEAGLKGDDRSATAAPSKQGADLQQSDEFDEEDDDEEEESEEEESSEDEDDAHSQARQTLAAVYSLVSKRVAASEARRVSLQAARVMLDTVYTRLAG